MALALVEMVYLQVVLEEHFLLVQAVEEAEAEAESVALAQQAVQVLLILEA
jgi:hypothetical protein